MKTYVQRLFSSDGCAAPSSVRNRKQFNRALEALRAKGYEIIFKFDRYFA